MMAASNRSIAAREGRVEPHDSLDDFPTPPWAGRALCERLIADHGPIATRSAWEPAVNRGALWRGLDGYFDRVEASDIHDYGHVRNCRIVDFLWPGSEPDGPVDFVVTNPPFRLAEQFVARAMEVANLGCAMLLRTNFLHSEGRYERLFSVLPPTRVLHFSERVVMLRGRLVRSGATDPASGKPASTATEYSWFVWFKSRDPMPPAWVPPGSRLRLEREGDYDLF